VGIDQDIDERTASDMFEIIHIGEKHLKLIIFPVALTISVYFMQKGEVSMLDHISITLLLFVSACMYCTICINCWDQLGAHASKCDSWLLKIVAYATSFTFPLAILSGAQLALDKAGVSKIIW